MNTCLSVKVDRVPPPANAFSVTSARAGGNWQDPQQQQFEIVSKSSFNCSDTRLKIDQYCQVLRAREERPEEMLTMMASNVANCMQLIFIKSAAARSPFPAEGYTSAVFSRIH